MTSITLYTGLVLIFLMIFNLFAQSFLTGLAVFVLTIFMIAKIPDTGDVVQYYLYGAGLLVLGANGIFMITKVKRF